MRKKYRYIVLLLAFVALIGSIFISRIFNLDGLLTSPPDLSTEKAVPQHIPSQPDSSGWEDLFNGTDLSGWKVTNFGPQGPVRVSQGAIVLGMGDGPTGITWDGDVLPENYEIKLDAMRVSGHDFFCGLTFPVGDEFCTLVVGGWGGTVVGLSSIDGMDASENFTPQSLRFEQQKWYPIKVRVTSDSISARVGGRYSVVVPRDGHKFSLRSEVLLSRPLGICSWFTTAALKNIRARSLVPGKQF